MGKLVEDSDLRDKSFAFEDRREAGGLLAKRLLSYKGTDTIVLAIPSGGIPIALEIADTIDLPMDLIIARKLQIPYNPEAGFGAVGPDGEVIVNEELLDQLRLTEREIQKQVKKTLDVIHQRSRIFRGGHPFPEVADKTVIVVDDGLASGYTMLAAVRSLKKMRPKRVIVAVPTGSRRTIDLVLDEVDLLVCLNVRSRFPFAVADAYRNWYDLGDDEVLSLLKNKHFIARTAI